MHKFINLEDIIDIQAFQKIQDDIAKATGVAIITTDFKGKPITKHSSCTEYCNIIRSNEKYAGLCEKCDSIGGIEAARIGRPHIYICHRGLVDFAIPIIVENQYLGLLMSGQVLVKNKQNSNLEKIISINDDNDDKLKKAYDKLTVLSFQKIKDIAEMMFHIANYIVREGILKISEKKIHETNNEMIKSQIKQIELENQLEKFKDILIESKISQSFIFNMLNTISSMAMIENASSTREISCELSKMIRFTFQKSNKVVSLYEEIKYIETYLSLQKIRFKDRLKFNMEIKDKYNNIKIPFMSIYPFVENSIIHGLKYKERGGYININIEEDANWIILSIIDDGIGISKEKLKYINKQDSSSIINSNGINNVIQRMRKHFGNNYSVNIQSNLDKGTEVILKFTKDNRW